jgi:hypothetical protein
MHYIFLPDILFAFPRILNRSHWFLSTSAILFSFHIHIWPAQRYLLLYSAIYFLSKIMHIMLIGTLLVAFAAADSGRQPVARSPMFAGAQLARRQGSCFEFGG